MSIALRHDCISFERSVMKSSRLHQPKNTVEKTYKLHRIDGVRLTLFGCLCRRDAGCPAPPAQSRTCSFPASGSSVVLTFARTFTVTRYKAQLLLS
jgi:hypothetical protein